MTDIPIIFSASMIRALLRQVDEPGTGKTRTRRLAWQIRTVRTNRIPIGTQIRPSPWQKVKPGDRLYVRENFRLEEHHIGRKIVTDCWYQATDADAFLPEFKWKPSIHHPRAHSRLTLVITSTRIERLHEIDEQDCESEGLRWKNGLWRCPAPDGGDWHATEKAIDCWRWLWTKLHGEESWCENPEVVVLGFSVHKVNIDSMKEAA